MELLYLRYFRVVAETQNMTEAARRLNIAQPVISKVIKNIEGELGVLLFDRIGRNIYLNHNGEILLRYTYDIFSALENAKREIENSNKLINETITLSMLAASKLLPKLISGFKHDYVNVQFAITLHEPNVNKQPEWDFCIDSSIDPPEDENSIVLIKEELYVAIPSNHKLSAQANISLKDIANEPFISLQKGSSLRNITNIICSNAGFKPNVVLECDDPSTIRGLINMGLGVSFIPGVTWSGFADSNICLKKISDTDCNRYITLTTSRHRYYSETGRLFKAYVIEYFKKLSDNIRN